MTRAKRTMMALLVLLAVACMAAPALAAEKTVPSTKGWYTIRSNTNGKLALDAKNGGTDDGTNLRAYRANRTLDQLFQFKKVKSGVYEIACAANGKLVTIKGNSAKAKADIQFQADKNKPTQRWRLVTGDDGSVTIVNTKKKRLALGVVGGGSAKKGANVRLYAVGSSQAITWKLTAQKDLVKAGYYRIARQTSRDNVLAVKNSSKKNHAHVVLSASSTDALAQTWKISPVEGAVNTYTIESVNSGKVISVAGGKALNKANVRQEKHTGSEAQQWTAVIRTNGGVGFKSAASSGSSMMLAVKGNSTKDGANIQLARRSRSAAQGFYLVNTSAFQPGYYLINTALSSSLMVSANGKANEANVELENKKKSAAQVWQAQDNKDGTFTFLRYRSDKTLAVAGSSAANNTNVWQSKPDGSKSQEWDVEYAGGGKFTISPALKPNLHLGTKGASAANGTDVRVYTAGKARAQQFGFTPFDLAKEIRKRIGISTNYRSVFEHGEKPAAYQKYIVMHDTEGGGNANNIISGWASNGRRVAAHFIVNRDGSIVQCVPIDKIAHHAGYGDNGHNRKFGVPEDGRDDMRGARRIGSWATNYGMNSWSVGIEMVHNHGTGYPAAQLKGVDRLIAYIDAYYGFECRIIDHNDWRTGNSDCDSTFQHSLRNLQRTRGHSGKPYKI